MKEKLEVKKGPTAGGPYSQIIRAGDFVYIAGQASIDPESGEMVEGDIYAQTRRTMENIKNMLSNADCTFEDVVRANVYLKDIKQWSKMNEVYETYFEGDFPTRVAVEASMAIEDLLVEISVIVYKPKSS